MLKDKRDDYKDVPWQQGRMLWTAITRRMPPQFHREAQEREARSLFAHFTAEDEGRGRVFLWQYDTAEECSAAVEQHNRELAERLKTPNARVSGPQQAAQD